MNDALSDLSAEEVAQWFHEYYEDLAPQFSYKTRKRSAVKWENVPKNNRDLMIATAGLVLERIKMETRC